MSITYPKEEFLQAYRPSDRFTKTIMEQKSDALPFLKKPKASYILPSFQNTSPYPNSEQNTLSEIHLSSKYVNLDPKSLTNNKETPVNRIKNLTPTEDLVPSKKAALSPDKFDALAPHLQQRFDQIYKIYNPPTQNNTYKLPPKPSTKSNSGIPFSRKSSKKFPAPVNNLFPENSSHSQLVQPFFSPDPKQKRVDYQHRSGSLSPLKIPKRKSFIPDSPLQIEDQQQQEYGGSNSEILLEDLRESNLVRKAANIKSPNLKYSKSSSLRGKKVTNSPQPSVLEDSDDEILLEEAKDGFMLEPRKLTNNDKMFIMKASTDTVSSSIKPFDETESPRAFHLANISELQQRARAISVPKPSSKLRIVKNLYINNQGEEPERERQAERKGYAEYSTHSLRSSLQVGMPIIINPEPRNAETEVTDRSSKKNAFFDKKESLGPLRFTQLRDTSNHKKWAESVKAKNRDAAYRYNPNSSVLLAGEHERSHNTSQLFRTPKEKRLAGLHERADKTPEPFIKQPFAVEKEGRALVGNNENKKNKVGLKLHGEFVNAEKEPMAKLKSLVPSSLSKGQIEQPKLTSDQRYEKLMSSNIKDKFNEVFRALRLKKKKKAAVPKKVQFSEGI